MWGNRKLSSEDYRALAEFRHHIRLYIRFSEKVVRNAGLEPREYQLLLALKGLTPDVRPRIAEIAEQLRIHHHSAVALVDGLETKGLVRRKRGTTDRREVLVMVTPAGEAIISKMVAVHLAEVVSRGPMLLNSVQRVLRRAGGRAG
jgi:DNA-binding MarR family transcriptional regulator